MFPGPKLNSGCGWIEFGTSRAWPTFYILKSDELDGKAGDYRIIPISLYKLYFSANVLYFMERMFFPGFGVYDGVKDTRGRHME